MTQIDEAFLLSATDALDNKVFHAIVQNALYDWHSNWEWGGWKRTMMQWITLLNQNISYNTERTI